MTITFAHRGGRAHERENTITAFRAALARGAEGLESDVRTSADGDVVLIHDARIRLGLRFVRVRSTATERLERAGVHRLDELYEECGTDYELSLDLKDDRVAEPTVAVARRHRAQERLWLCSPDLDLLAALRQRHRDVHLVHSLRVNRIEGPLERHAARLADAGIDAVNFHHSEWTGGLVALYHRFARQAFGWDAQELRHVTSLLRMGIDGVYSDHTDRMVAAVTAWDAHKGARD